MPVDDIALEQPPGERRMFRATRVSVDMLVQQTKMLIDHKKVCVCVCVWR